MAITLRDIAKECNLSPSTVSDVLNSRSRSWASEETRRRVFAVAERMGYRPHSAAQALRTGKSYVVTFVSLRNWGTPVVTGIEFKPGSLTTFDGAAEVMAARLGERGYDLKLHIYPDQAQLMAGLNELVRRKASDAIVLFGRESDVAEQGSFLAQYDIPFVVKGRHERDFPDWYQVEYDHEAMMRSAIELLVSHGQRNIGYIGHFEQEVYQHRLRDGFETAYRDRFGIHPHESWLYRLHGDPTSELPVLIERWFSLPPSDRPTAVVIGTSDTEWRLLEMLFARRGIRIGYEPGDFAVCGQGTGNLHLAFGAGHYFADISQYSIADTAVRHLLMPLLNGEKPHQSIHRILPDLEPTHSLGLAFVL